MTAVYNFFKRLFDVFVSGIAVVILTPLLSPVMLALRLTGEGEVFYRQKRIGYHNTTFAALRTK